LKWKNQIPLILLEKKCLSQLKQTMIQYHSKEEQTLSLTKQCQVLKVQLEQKELECTRSTEAISNLQNVLEQLQAEQETQLNSEILLLRKDLKFAKEEVEKMKTELTETRVLASKCKIAEQIAMQLQEDLSKQTRIYIKLQEEVDPLRKAFDQTLGRLTSMTKNEENQIDKRLMARLLITFFQNKANKTEVLELMTRMLNFTEQEKKDIGLVSNAGRWSFIPFFSSSEESTVAENYFVPTSDRTLTDMWVDFLLKEATAEKKN